MSFAGVEEPDLGWEQALAILRDRGWDRRRVVDAVLGLLRWPGLRWDLPAHHVSLRAREPLDECGARALLVLTRTWLLGDEPVRRELMERVRELGRVGRSD